MITLGTIFLLSHYFGQCVQLPNTWMADKYGFAFTCPAGEAIAQSTHLLASLYPTQERALNMYHHLGALLSVFADARHCLWQAVSTADACWPCFCIRQSCGMPVTSAIVSEVLLLSYTVPDAQERLLALP